MRNRYLTLVLLLGCGVSVGGQSQVERRTLVINGHTGEVTIYRIDNHAFIDLDTLTQIGSGSVEYQDGRIVLTLPAIRPSPTLPQSDAAEPRLSSEFVTSAIQELATIKEWHSTIAFALQRGVPGDGSRLAVLRDRAVTGLQLTSAQGENDADRSALALLNLHFKRVDTWYSKVMGEHRTMDTAKYSMSVDALDRDPDYQQIKKCQEFLGRIFADGKYSEDSVTCH